MKPKSLLPLALVAAACSSHRAGVAALAPLPMRDVEFPPADSANAMHVLNRMAFGPRPGDIAHIQAVGIGGWLEEQLNPARVSDSAELAALAPHELALRDPTDLFEAYAPGPAARLDSAERRRMQEGARDLAQHVMMSALARHVASDRQLLEVMTDFWTNHFNVFMGKEADRFLVADFVEKAIRPNALGRFEDLLVATAEHPAMLIYLDNAQSVAPGSRPPAAGRRPVALGPVRGGFPGMFPRPVLMPVAARPAAGAARAPNGINENYARELMELHTLGVDGGYMQQDVINVARIFTGWGVSRPRPMGPGRFAFEYHDWAHDYGEKEVLGVRFTGGGMKEGLRLLHLLAEHPSTARHISHKLCARFVADDPPDGCVDAAVAAWQRTHGDIRAVLKAMVASPDFWAAESRRARFKTPLEFVASAVRALGAEPDTTPRLLYALQQLGEPPFMRLTPDGYPEVAADWLNSGAILTRMNLALALASGRMPGVVANLDSLIPVTSDYDELVRRVNAVILGGQASDRTLQTIRRQIEDLPNTGNARAMAVALALGSPDFQRE